jgi:hypothetical protein
MRLPGQSNKPDIPGYMNNTIIEGFMQINKEKGG